MSPRLENIFNGLTRALAGSRIAPDSEIATLGRRHTDDAAAASKADEMQQPLGNAEHDTPRHQMGPVVIENVAPAIEGGKHPIKRVTSDIVNVEADIFREGHEALAAMLYFRIRGSARWDHTPMILIDNDRFGASFTVHSPVAYEYTIEAWPDPFGSWQVDAAKKLAAGQPVSLELVEGRRLIVEVVERTVGSTRASLEGVVAEFDAADSDRSRAAVLLREEVRALAARARDRSTASRFWPTLLVDVERPLAQFSAWYELFPRSQGSTPGVHGTFADVEHRLPAIAAMGFDIAYLPPIHPIGVAFRKGRNNSLDPEPDDVGSPWAIGNENGGHTAIEPALGTFDDFARLVRAARANGLEIALDYALQCSPDHPWITEHPAWFAFRSDGSIKYAENPPKKYQDIVNFNWFGPERSALWNALRDIVLFWIARGVTVFRVDNPHTKPFVFWEWMIAQVRAKHPGTIFLAEAFTRPKPMHYLAKTGFSQSYTYFTWRTTKDELVEYVTELATGELADSYRPNFWPNTPDILSPFLQTGGRPAFVIRLMLAATLSSNYGIYSGFELAENAALPGREEYLDSEKYEIRVRDWNAPGNLTSEIAALNRIRRENVALQDWRNVEFFRADDEEVLFFSKQSGDNLIFVAINLDPFAARDALLWMPIGDHEVPDDAEYGVEELLGETKHVWRGSPHRWRLDPHLNPAAIFRVTFPKPENDSAGTAVGGHAAPIAGHAAPISEPADAALGPAGGTPPRYQSRRRDR
jgi:starch synthase (maltosyl-transferring)